jgi:endonuclease YncB( thermonuclease family)
MAPISMRVLKMSIRAITTAASVLLASVWLAPALDGQAPPRGSGPYTVTGPVRVIDGDTLEIYLDGRRTGIAIAGVKAPPGNSACGRRAAAMLRELTSGVFELHEETTLLAFDRRLRRVYRIVAASGMSIGEELARRGVVLPDTASAAATGYPAIAAAAAQARADAAGCVGRASAN